MYMNAQVKLRIFYNAHLVFPLQNLLEVNYHKKNITTKKCRLE